MCQWDGNSGIKTGNAAGKTNSIPYYIVFLDSTQVYNMLDCKHNLVVLKGYGIGNVRRFISQVWKGPIIVINQAKYFDKVFKASRGVKQGDVISPMIFNIVEDAVA
jgi:hypothetical protein